MRVAKVMAVLAVLALGCGKGTDRVTRDRTPTENLPAVAQELGVKLPPSARLIGVARESGMDDLVRAKFEINADELDGFLASTPVDPQSMRPGGRGFLGPDEGFWDPRQARSLRTGQALIAGARALNIGVAEGGAKIAVLYIVNHGT
jgi:hypothetical protein